ncbi:hypothetical protein Pelo_13305 [Pelomyxa schiedti]|nr:hypothetical protein Pelo_13305 [Pelomyxa schiedti]
MTTPPLSQEQSSATFAACVRACVHGDMPQAPVPTWDFNTPIIPSGATMLHIACVRARARAAREEAPRRGRDKPHLLRGSYATVRSCRIRKEGSGEGAAGNERR